MVQNRQVVSRTVSLARTGPLPYVSVPCLDNCSFYTNIIDSAMIFWIILVVVMVLAVVLIGMVLLQPSKGGGIGSAFGTLGTQLGSTFGSRRTLDFLAKGTTWVAGGIAVLCILANAFFVPRVSRPTPVTQGQSATPTTVPAAPTLPQGGASAPATGGQQPAAQPNAAQPEATQSQTPDSNK
jgi:preprotein translocase subunit SecG